MKVLCYILLSSALLSCENVVTVPDGRGCAQEGPDTLVCHDFEDGLNGTISTRDGTVAEDTEIVFDGTTSMRAQTTKINAEATLNTAFDPIETGTIYFRMHVYIPVGTVVGNTKLLNLSRSEEPVTDVDRGVDINISQGMIVNIYQHANTTRFESAAGIVTEGRWFCLRGSYSISETSGATLVWIDDNLAVSTTASADAIINGGVARCSVGIGWTELGQDTAVFYFDNVLVATIPVDC